MDDPQLEDYHFFGTKGGSREAREGKRLHGAFTGGFAAGYDNTCGSALSWQPSQERRRKQSVEDFMDDDELEEYNKTVLGAKQQYDTFGLAARDTMARELARVEGEAPGTLLVVPSIMVAPVAQGIGVRLLLRMGWRRGKGLDFDRNEEMIRLMDHAKSMRDLGEEARRALRVGDTELEPMPKPKSDSFGLGFDPYKGGFEELRWKKGMQSQGQGRSSRGRGPGIAFGTGVVDDEDDAGILEDYVAHDAMDIANMHGGDLLDANGRPRLRHQGPGRDGLGDRLLREGYSFEIQDVQDDDGGGPILLGGPESAPMLSDRAHVDRVVGRVGAVGPDAHASILPGFVFADDDVLPLVYPRPSIERDFVPRVPTWVKHRSSLSVPRSDVKPAKLPPPGPLKLRIDQVALQVARSGADFEALVSASDSFVMSGDEYHEYYVWKVNRYGQMMRRGQEGPAGPTATGFAAPPRLAIEERSRILGEKQLEEDRKKMEAMMAAKFVRAGGNDETLAPNVTIIDMSKRPPAVRTIESWVPESLLRKRLGIKHDDGHEEDSAKRGSGKSKRKRRESGLTEVEGQPKPPEEDADAILAAEAFLNSLLTETPVDVGGNDGSTDGGAFPLNKPLDLFQEIFEGQDEGMGDEGGDEGGDEDGDEDGDGERDVFKPVPIHYEATRDQSTESFRPTQRTQNRDRNVISKHQKDPKDPKDGKHTHPPSPPHRPTIQPPPERLNPDDERIRKALRILEKEKRRKDRRAERKKEKLEKKKEKKKDKKKDKSGCVG